MRVELANVLIWIHCAREHPRAAGLRLPPQPPAYEVLASSAQPRITQKLAGCSVRRSNAVM